MSLRPSILQPKMQMIQLPNDSAVPTCLPGYHSHEIVHVQIVIVLVHVQIAEFATNNHVPY